jgi:hypothetical protein
LEVQTILKPDEKSISHKESSHTNKESTTNLKQLLLNKDQAKLAEDPQITIGKSLEGCSAM